MWNLHLVRDLLWRAMEQRKLNVRLDMRGGESRQAMHENKPMCINRR